MESKPEKIKVTKKKANSAIFKNSDCPKRRKILNENTNQDEIPDLMNSNSSTKCKRINEEMKNDMADSIDSSDINSFSMKNAELIQNIFKTGMY